MKRILCMDLFKSSDEQEKKREFNKKIGNVIRIELNEKPGQKTIGGRR